MADDGLPGDGPTTSRGELLKPWREYGPPTEENIAELEAMKATGELVVCDERGKVPEGSWDRKGGFMSWWIYLEDHRVPPACSYGVPPEKFRPEHEGDAPCPVPCHPSVVVETEDGNGREAELNVTWNYGGHFRFPDLHGLCAGETIPALEEAVGRLGTERDADGWAKTPGNAGATCAVLLSWARQHPDAVWNVR